MKPDEFEKKLSRQPLRVVPGEWRAEILAAARAHEPVCHSSFVVGRSWFAALLWPHPKAWAGLAAVWIAIFALNSSMRDNAPVSAKTSAERSPEALAELRQEQKMFTELIGSMELRVADRQRVLSPKPRSERAEILAG